ncbi:MAG: OmpP1/FadL family transporter [Bacteroidia bacterium]
MKKFLISGLMGIFCSQTMAQNDMDAIRYTNKKFGSTAKSMSLAGAVGSLGADVSTASVNPAGLAQFQKGEFSFSMGFVNSKNTSTYLGNSVADNTFNMNLPNLGLVFANKTLTKKGERGWKNYTIAFNLARVADFNRVVNFSGTNTHTSLMDYFAERATLANLTVDQLLVTDSEKEEGFESKTSMAYYAYLFDSIGNRKYAAHASPIFHSIYQKGVMQQSGGMNEYNFSVAGNYSDVVYLGATINYTTVNFKENRTHSESNDPEDNQALSMDNFTYTENLHTTGGGFSGRLGMIVKPHDYVRLGASIQTPQIIKLDDEYDFKINSTLRNGEYYNFESKKGIYTYSLLTPARYTFSATGIIGKRGFVSADIEKVDYSAMRLRSTDGNNAMEIANDDIRSKYTSAINYRIGGELVMEEFRLRGGFASYASPFINKETNNLRSDFVTGGFGIKEKNWALDLGIVHALGQDVFQPYVLNDNSRPQVQVHNKFSVNTVIITLTTKF